MVRISKVQTPAGFVTPCAETMTGLLEGLIPGMMLGQSSNIVAGVACFPDDLLPYFPAGRMRGLQCRIGFDAPTQLYWARAGGASCASAAEGDWRRDWEVGAGMEIGFRMDADMGDPLIFPVVSLQAVVAAAMGSSMGEDELAHGLCSLVYDDLLRMYALPLPIGETGHYKAWLSVQGNLELLPPGSVSVSVEDGLAVITPCCELKETCWIYLKVVISRSRSGLLLSRQRQGAFIHRLDGALSLQAIHF